MTDHLVGGHPSPSSLAINTQLGQSIQYFAAVALIRESLHLNLNSILRISDWRHISIELIDQGSERLTPGYIHMHIASNLM